MGKWERKAKRQINRETAGNDLIHNAQLQAARDTRNDAISAANSGSAALQELIGKQLQGVRNSRLKGYERRSAIERLKAQKIQAASQAPYLANQARANYQDSAQALSLSALSDEVARGQAVSKRAVDLRQARNDGKATLAEEAAELAEEAAGYRSLGYDEAKYGADELTAARAALDSGLTKVRSYRDMVLEDGDEWNEIDSATQEKIKADLEEFDFGTDEGWYSFAQALGGTDEYPDVNTEDMRRAVTERINGAGGSRFGRNLNRSLGY